MQVKMFNLMETKVIRDLNPSDINKLISVGGMVTRASTIIPDLQCAPAPVCRRPNVLTNLLLAKSGRGAHLPAWSLLNSTWWHC